MQSFVIGVDIGGTNTKLALVDEQLKAFELRSFATGAHAPWEEFRAQLLGQLQELKGLALGHGATVRALGVGAPSTDYFSGRMQGAGNFRWGERNLRSELEDLTGLRCVVDNDANLCAWGEYLAGEGKGARELLTLTLGTGVGGGVVSQGRLVRARRAPATELGHIVLYPEGRVCSCGQQGHLEAYASATALRFITQEVMGEEVSADELSQLIAKGESKAVQVYQRFVKDLALGLVSLCACFGPERIVLAGGVSALSQDLAHDVEERLRRDYFFSPHFCPEVRVSGLRSGETAVIGAAALALESMGKHFSAESGTMA